MSTKGGFMINIEHKLTVDDLIVEYMIYKTDHGYEPSFSTSEFIHFLHFFESRMEVEDLLYEKEELFNRFFERKNRIDWYHEPHMDRIKDKTNHDSMIQANYKLSYYDRSVINTYFMEKGQTFKLKKLIEEYLANIPKRSIDDTIDVEENDLLIGKYIAAQIIQMIWESHIDKLIEHQKWPSQCKDINKYLLETDVSTVIHLKSIKKELLELYHVISKRIAVMYHQDRNLQISSAQGDYLANSNYKLFIQGYEELFRIAFDKYNKSLNIDLSTFTLRESHTSDGVYDWDDETDVETTTTLINDNKVKKLAGSLDQHYSQLFVKN